MANFNNEVSTSGFDAQSYASETARTRNQTRESSNAGWITANSSYDVVGLNTTKIGDMKTAIDNYVNDVYEHLKNVKVDTDPSVALKGTGMEEAVKSYVAKVVEYCEALCSNLLAFNDKLTKVEEAWRASDKNMSSKVTAGEGDVSAATSTYTEQFRTAR